MPTSFSNIVPRLFTFRCYCYNHYKTQKYYFCYCYRYFHTTVLLNTLLQILSYPGVVELTTQLLILENILWLPLCRINKFGLNTLPSKAVAIPYTCGLSCARDGAKLAESLVVAEERRQLDQIVALAQEASATQIPTEEPADEAAFKPSKETKKVKLNLEDPSCSKYVVVGTCLDSK